MQHPYFSILAPPERKKLVTGLYTSVLRNFPSPALSSAFPVPLFSYINALLLQIFEIVNTLYISPTSRICSLPTITGNSTFKYRSATITTTRGAISSTCNLIKQSSSRVNSSPSRGGEFERATSNPYVSANLDSF